MNGNNCFGVCGYQFSLFLPLLTLNCDKQPNMSAMVLILGLLKLMY